MSYHYNPHIVTDGLVLCLDAKDDLARGKNLISNGEFSDGTTGWTGYAGTTLSRVAADADPGSASGGSDDYCMKVSGPYMAYTSITTVIGKSYWVTLRGYEGGGDPGRNSLKISNTSDGGNISGTSEVYITPDATWVVKTQTFTATATTTYIRVGANSGGGGGSNLSYFDNISVYEMLWKDLSGNGNDGTVSGTTGMAFNSGSGYFSFGGDETTDLITVSHDDSLNFGSGNFSITLFFNPSSTASQTGLLQKAADWSTAGWRIRFANGGLEYQLRPGHHYANGTTNLSTNTWYHGAITGNVSDTWAKIYINGVEETLEQGSGEMYNVGNMNNTADLWIGRYYSAGYTMNGSIANVCMYKKELSATEVLQNFNAHRGRFGV